MDNLSATRLWIMRAAFVALALVILFFHLLPLDTLPRRWAPPDLLIASVFAWTLRRPEFVPPLSIAVVMLVADLMLQRQQPRRALLVLLGSEYLKNRAPGLREAGFAREWAAVAIVVLAVTLLNRLVLAVLLVPQAPLGPSLIQMVATIAAYPLVALITQTVLGVRRPAPINARTMGSRI